MPSTGLLQVQLFQGNSYVPVENARIIVSQPTNTGTRVVEQSVATDSSGLTSEVELEAPSIEYSMRPTDIQPYSLADIRIEAQGFIDVTIRGVQIFPEILALQQFNLKPVTGRRQVEIIEIAPNSLFANDPPKIPENPEKPLPKPPSGFVVLPEPVVPEFIIVHAGRPNDNTAPNYTVKFEDYIKNVASSEIYATWSESTIRANTLCILSFALNRIYTEWYRGQGKNFDVTNSTAFDQAFSYGRNIYGNISRIVDEIFNNYVKRPGAKQPLFTQYCDGKNVQCPGWLTQWGSKYLGDQGRTPIEILKNFYGNNLVLTKADKVRGIPKSYPGYPLRVGSTGAPVRSLQEYLNRIGNNYPAIPKVAVDGNFGPKTKAAVTEFQKIFKLPPTGIVDEATWYKISSIYVGVTKIAELTRNFSESDYYYTEGGLFVPPSLSIDENIPITTFPLD